MSDVITTYLIATEDGSVATSNLHTQASSIVRIDSHELIVSFRQRYAGEEEFDLLIANVQSPRNVTDLTISDLYLFGINGEELVHAIRLQQTRSIISGTSNNMSIQNYRLNLREFAEPNSLLLKISLSGSLGGEAFATKEAVAFVRAEVKIPVSYR